MCVSESDNPLLRDMKQWCYKCSYVFCQYKEPRNLWVYINIWYPNILGQGNLPNSHLDFTFFITNIQLQKETTTIVLLSRCLLYRERPPRNPPLIRYSQEVIMKTFSY